MEAGGGRSRAFAAPPADFVAAALDGGDVVEATIAGHPVDTAYEQGWSDLRNDVLLASAQLDGCELQITTDHHILYQQNPS